MRVSPAAFAIEASEMRASRCSSTNRSAFLRRHSCSGFRRRFACRPTRRKAVCASLRPHACRFMGEVASDTGVIVAVFSAETSIACLSGGSRRRVHLLLVVLHSTDVRQANTNVCAHARIAVTRDLLSRTLPHTRVQLLPIPRSSPTMTAYIPCSFRSLSSLAHLSSPMSTSPLKWRHLCAAVLPCGVTVLAVLTALMPGIVLNRYVEPHIRLNDDTLLQAQTH